MQQLVRRSRSEPVAAHHCEKAFPASQFLILPPLHHLGPCPERHFHVEETGQCLPCFCFGVAKSCRSTGRYRQQIHLRFDEHNNFKGEAVGQFPPPKDRTGCPSLSTSHRPTRLVAFLFIPRGERDHARSARHTSPRLDADAHRPQHAGVPAGRSLATLPGARLLLDSPQAVPREQGKGSRWHTLPRCPSISWVFF